MTVTNLWMRLWFEIFEPDITIFGIVTNFLVVLVMPRSKVAVGSSAKIYYISMSISDFFNLINSWLLYAVVNDSMYACRL